MGVGGGQSRARDGVLLPSMTDSTRQPLLPNSPSITPLPPAPVNFYVWIHSVIQIIDMENLYHSFTNRMFLLPPCRYVGPYSVIQTYMIDIKNLLNLLSPSHPALLLLPAQCHPDLHDRHGEPAQPAGQEAQGDGEAWS